MSGKRVSATDMLGSRRKPEPETVPSPPVDSSPSRLVAPAPLAYRKLAIYVRPEQLEWLEDQLGNFRDAEGHRVRGFSISDIARLAFANLQASVQDGYPLMEELIKAAEKDIETFPGRKNRGIPKL